MMRMIKQRKYSQGVSLIEILVSVIVLAFGLLGLAGLQAHSLQNNNNAILRTQAMYLAQDIIDRMRVNRTAAIDDMEYEQPMGDAKPTGTALSAVDLNAWLTNVENGLPNGDGEVDCTDSTDVCVVTIQWRDSRDPNTPALQFVTSAEL